MSEPMKLLGNTKSKITTYENGVAVLPRMIISMIQESCIHLFLINPLVKKK